MWCFIIVLEKSKKLIHSSRQRHSLHVVLVHVPYTQIQETDISIYILINLQSNRNFLP